MCFIQKYNRKYELPVPYWSIFQKKYVICKPTAINAETLKI